MSKFLVYEYVSKSLKEIEFNHELDFLSVAYRSIQCEWIEYATLTSTIDIIVDDEGALKENNYINTIYDKQLDRVQFLFGNLMFVGFENGKTVGLSEKQINYIKDNVIVDTIPIEVYKALK